MTFLWPPMLLSLACIPLGVAAAVAIGRRRRRWARTAGLDLGRHGTRGATGWRGRLPVLLFLAGFAALGIALARPQGVLSVPQAEGSVIRGD